MDPLDRDINEDINHGAKHIHPYLNSFLYIRFLKSMVKNASGGSESFEEMLNTSNTFSLI